MRRRGRRRSKETEEEQTASDAEQTEAMPEGRPQDVAREEGAPPKADGVRKEEDNKDSPAIMKKEGLLTQLFEWEGEGYDTSTIEEAVQKNDPNLDRMCEEFKANIEKLKGIVDEMEKMEVDERLIDDIQKIRDMMNNPNKVKEIDAALGKLKGKSGMMRYQDDIDSMHTEGFEKEVKAIQDLMTDPANAPAIEKKLADLKRMVKERFFEQEIAMSFKPKPLKKVKKIKIVKTKMGAKAEPFKIHDVFLFHHNGGLISHHTRRTDIAESKGQIANMLKVIQGNIKSPKRKDIKRIEFDKYKILFQDANNVTVSAAISGSERNEMFLLMKKVSDLIEKKYTDQLGGWDGNSGSLKGIDKYIAALIQVFVKMELKVQGRQV